MKKYLFLFGVVSLFSARKAEKFGEPNPKFQKYSDEQLNQHMEALEKKLGEVVIETKGDEESPKFKKAQEEHTEAFVEVNRRKIEAENEQRAKEEEEAEIKSGLIGRINNTMDKTDKVTDKCECSVM